MKERHNVHMVQKYLLRFILFSVFILLIIVFRDVLVDVNNGVSHYGSLLTLLLVSSTAIAAYSANKSSKVSEKFTRATFLPILKLSVDETDKEKFKLTITNIGQQIAQDISVSIPSAHPSSESKTPYNKNFEVIEVGQQPENDFVYYRPDKLTKSPYVVVKYKDIFGGDLMTVGRVTFRVNEHNQAEQVGAIIWEFKPDQ